jgi:hypothetical protein
MIHDESGFASDCQRRQMGIERVARETRIAGEERAGRIGPRVQLMSCRSVGIEQPLCVLYRAEALTAPDPELSAVSSGQIWSLRQTRSRGGHVRDGVLLSKLWDSLKFLPD